MFGAGLAFGTLDRIVVPVDAFEMAGVLVFGGQRGVEVDVDDVWNTRPFGLLDGPAPQKGAERLGEILGSPGTDAQAAGHIRDIGGVGHRLARLADQ